MVFEEILESFRYYDLEEARAMKYPSVQRFERALDKFCKCKNLKEWLQSDYRDAYHTAQSFYYQAFENFEISERKSWCCGIPSLYSLENIRSHWQSLSAELKECKEFLSEFEKVCSAIFVETEKGLEIKSMSEAYAAAWIKAQKYFFPPDGSLNFKDIDEVLRICGEEIKKHYKKNNGQIVRLGRICGYRVSILGVVCRFDCQGRFQKFLQIPLEREDRRSLFERLKEKLNQTSYRDLASKMGYGQEFWIFKKGVDILLECKDLKEWVGRGFYALKMKSNHFFIKLCEILLDEEDMAVAECREIRGLIKRCEKFDGVIYVQTLMDKENVSHLDYGFSNCLREMKEIYFDRRIFCHKSLDEGLQICGEIVRNHHARNDGKLEIWGEITGYMIKIGNERHYAKIDGLFWGEWDL